MVDIENVFQALDEYLTGGQTAIGAAADLAEPMVEETREPFVPEDDIGEIAYQHARNLNGMEVDQREREGEIDESGRRNIALTREYFEGRDDEDIHMEEDPDERRHRYMNSRMEEVSEPDEWYNSIMVIDQSSTTNACWHSPRPISNGWQMLLQHFELDEKQQR